ncbi:MAG: cyclophilin-like fold protein [Clostridia bacterium]|nr:cyclophilin-like fold protein [Clostridia bacterium]
MKPFLPLLLSAALLLSLTACAGSAAPAAEAPAVDASAPALTEAPAEAPVETATPESTQAPIQESVGSQENSNNLIVYFSRYGNTEYPDNVDATTSASIVVDGNGQYGTTEYVASLIQQAVGGDVHRIETVTPYTADFDELREVNHEEMQQDFLPELEESNLDISAYDTVFIGYPVWATGVPQAVISFLHEYDLSTKTVIPFCTHDGYGAGNSYQEIAAASHAAASPDGIAIEAKDVLDAQETVSDWLTAIGMLTSKERTETAIHITIGDITLYGVLYDTALAEEIEGYFPLTISMVEYAGREYYGGVDFYPVNLEGGQRNFENGDITYCDAHHNMAVFFAQTDDPTLSVDVIPIGRITSDLSVFDGLDSREDITFSLAQ